MSLGKIKKFICLIPRKILIMVIKLYQIAISPLLPASCRFIPTCSEYGITALKRFGFFKGLYLTVRRILRCRPGGGCGYDPVPETWDKRN
jgi:uncharacterized protein